MRQSRLIIIFFLASMVCMPIFGQTFPCDGSLIFSTSSNNTRTSLIRINFGPFGTIFYDRFRHYSAGFNGLGFNPQDNYIYGVRTNTNEIVRLKFDNTFEVVGTVPSLDKLTSTAGECTPDGFYLCHDQELDQILVFDVVDNFALVNQIDLFWNTQSGNSGPFTTRIDDFAIDPTNPTVAYSFQGNYFGADLEPDETRGYLLQINLDFQSPNLGRVTPIAEIPRNIIRKIGSLIFSADGTLYAYGAQTQGPDPTQNQLLRVDKTSGEVTVFNSTGPSGINSDGCSCPYFLSFSNAVNPNFALCTDSKVNYNLAITNRFFQDIPNASVIDTFPEGMIISNISGNFSGNIAVGTGVGTRVFQLDNIDIPARSGATINIEVEIIDLPIQFISNQAILTNLPERFGYELVSDDPATMGFVGDATNIFSDPQRLEEFTIDITHTTDCLKPEDGKAVISSPIFIPGIEYEVNFQNEDFEEFAEEVIIDEQNTFVLDSLFPGEYKLYKITPKDSKCSFAMKDTTITVLAPNHLIQAEVTTNSPICEGSTLELTTTFFPPEGTVQWSSPKIFRFDGANLTIDSANAEQGGEYEMIFTYGACEQIRTLDIAVFPEIEATISGQSEFCARDSLRLTAEGAGNLTAFTWTDPNGNQSTQQVLEIPSANFENKGIYELIIDNGLCSDTTSTFIDVLPTPTLELPEMLKSKFCDPLVLEPKLSGSTNVVYSWTPSEGLSCADCPNPEIASPIQSEYNLMVRNEFACQDSADISVFLDEEGLIYIPNVFSPNGDGQNDHFQIFPNCGVQSIDGFQIYDRFGGLMYNLNSIEQFYDPNLFWNGSINQVQANEGLYLWQLKITLIDGTTRSLKGDVTLLR